MHGDDMTTALDRLRGMVAAARRDSLIATAEADILDRLARVAEDEDDDADGALDELADNLRRALDRCVVVDADDDLSSTGCRECAGVERIRVAVEQMAAEQKDASGRATAEFARVSEAVHNAGIEFADFYHEPHLVIDELAAQLNRSEHEHDEARAEIERLLAEVASLRQRPTRDELADYSRRMQAADTSAPTVGAPDAGPDAPAQHVEGDAAEGAPLEGAVPAAPVSGAEQSCGETGVDRPRVVDVDGREIVDGALVQVCDGIHVPLIAVAVPGTRAFHNRVRIVWLDQDSVTWFAPSQLRVVDSTPVAVADMGVANDVRVVPAGDLRGPDAGVER